MTRDGGLRADGLRAVLLDIEGTTTPVSFVSDVLFPYARARLRAFLETGIGDGTARADVDRLRAEHARPHARGEIPPAWREDDEEALTGSAISYAIWLMERDSKSTGLKSLQGRIWEEGYRRSDLRGEVFPDVPRAFERWRGRGLRLATFSSGSILAQRLLLASTPYGDLSRLLDACFDTTTGAKRDLESYARIAAAMGIDRDAILFLSDVAAELDAARRAGLATALCARGEAGVAPAGAGSRPGPAHPVIRTFDEVLP